MLNTEIEIQKQTIEGREIPCVSSRQIATKFGKKHAHVLRDIKNQPRDEFSLSNFGESEYRNSRGKVCPEYLITEKGFTLLAMGFTGDEARAWKIRFLEAFDALRIEASKEQQKRIETQAKTVSLWNRLTRHHGSISYRNAESMLGLGYGELGDLFIRHGICYRDPRTRRPMAYDGVPFVERVVYEGEYGPYGTFRVTAPGLAWASMKLDQEIQSLAITE